jgi:ribosomal protein S18 acetylase RimI-like enzyme
MTNDAATKVSLSREFPPITIRTATAADADLLFRLGVETFSDTFSRDNTPADMAIYLAQAFGRDIQAAELSQPGSHFLIAEAHAEAVGYARLLEGPSPVAVSGVKPIEIVRLYSRIAWIGRGVGALLMRACLSAASGRGCDTIWLGVWERNSRAIAFYEKWGFRKSGAHEFCVGNDVQTDWLMQRPVADA